MRIPDEFGYGCWITPSGDIIDIARGSGHMQMFLPCRNGYIRIRVDGKELNVEREKVITSAQSRVLHALQDKFRPFVVVEIVRNIHEKYSTLS